MLSYFIFQLLTAFRYWFVVKNINVEKVNTFQGIWSIPAWDAHLRWPLVIMVTLMIMLIFTHLRLFCDDKLSLLSCFCRVAYYWSDPERWQGSAGVGRLVDIFAAQHETLRLKCPCVPILSHLIWRFFFPRSQCLGQYLSPQNFKGWQLLEGRLENWKWQSITLALSRYILYIPISCFQRWQWLWFIMRPASKVSVQSRNFWDTKYTSNFLVWSCRFNMTSTKGV